MKNTNRYIALALCFTLTLGVFAYRPPQAEAIAGVDDAVVIGALLSAFAGGCGLIFSNNRMTSSELAQGLTDKWNEFNESAENAASSFAAWLGFEDTSALLGALSFSGSKLVIPRAIAQKFAEFTTWLTQNLGVTAGGEEKSVASTVGGYKLAFSDGSSLSLGMIDSSSTPYRVSYPGDVIFEIPADVGQSKTFTFSNGAELSFSLKQHGNKYYFVGKYGDVWSTNYSNGVPDSVLNMNVMPGSYTKVCLVVQDDGVNPQIIRMAAFCVVSDYTFTNEWQPAITDYDDYWIPNFDVDQLNLSQSPVTDFSVFAPSYYKNPTIDLPAEGEEAANPTLSGVGDGTATTIEDLLQQILEQLQANTLAPTLDVAGTETGGDTGTDEDSKPYLPYIPQIFEKIKDLPGTLSNIWETVKGIPAAIAEKIGAFFTSLWGWLSDIITEIKALPAAIAEKVGELFKPDEALITEITDTFKGKFGFLPTLKQFGDDLFGMTAETEPPVIWIHLENAESKYGYDYGGKTKALDLTWYQKYKANVDTIVSGFLWLAFLWLLFKRASSIIQGGEMVEQYSADISAGHREKGGKRK